MSFFKRALGAIGIGATNVDTVLDVHTFIYGGIISGTVNVDGGQVDQEINNICIHHYCEYFVEVEIECEDGTEETVIQRREHCLGSVMVSDGFTVEAESEHQFQFSIPMHSISPVSLDKSRNWIETELDIDNAFDKSDRDYFDVMPNTLQQSLLAAMEQLGFRLIQVECEAVSSGWRQLPFIQEMEFKPVSGPFVSCLDEVEIVMVGADGALDVYLEIDRRARGILGMLAQSFGHDDESHIHARFESEDADNMLQIMQDILAEYA